MSMTPSTSPLRSKPLRQAGQSLDEQIDHLRNDRMLPYAMIPVFYWIIAGLEWFAQWTGQPRVPAVYALIALVLSAYGGWRFWRIRKQLRRILLGREGERVVGQFLDTLRADGAQVFHDVVADGFNLDHVVICKQGVFVIETKTWSKPRGKATIAISNERVVRNGVPASSNAVGQVLGAAAWLRNLLQQSTGQPLFVHPVLLFPGWFIEPMDAATKARLWALVPSNLPKFLAHEPVRLSAEQVAMATLHLGAWVRTGHRQFVP
jgi:Nuclease-related domain